MKITVAEIKQILHPESTGPGVKLIIHSVDGKVTRQLEESQVIEIKLV